jgi:transcriptional regulator with XRE-family HTH domain
VTEKRNGATQESGPDDWPGLVRMLRAISALDQADFASAAGLDPSTVSRYEHGLLVPRQRSLDKLAAAAGVPPSLIAACLLPMIATLRGLASEPEASEDLEEVAAGFVRSFSGIARPQLAALLLDLTRLDDPPSSSPPSAAELWDRLEPCTPEEREFLVESAPEFQSPALAARLGEEHEKVDAADADLARHLARLALRIGELAAVGAEV